MKDIRRQPWDNILFALDETLNRFVPFEQWRDGNLDQQLSYSPRPPAPAVAPVPQRAAATARDRYGWRGLRGTSWIGPQEKEDK